MLDAVRDLCYVRGGTGNSELQFTRKSDKGNTRERISVADSDEELRNGEIKSERGTLAREDKDQEARYKERGEKNESSVENNRLEYISRPDTSLPRPPVYIYPGGSFVSLRAPSPESRSPWHLACILAADNLTLLHELRIYPISGRNAGKGAFNGPKRGWAGN